jgi:hypothetical protein
MRTKLISALTAATLLAILLAIPSTPLLADSGPARCTGTYLIEEAGGAKDFWTFGADGSFSGVTSTQPLYNFSNQQGSWQKVGHDARGALLAFVYNDDNTLMTTARIEILFHPVGQSCDQIAGTLEVRTFEEGEDPLDPATDSGVPLATDTFTGRRVKASP